MWGSNKQSDFLCPAAEDDDLILYLIQAYSEMPLIEDVTESEAGPSNYRREEPLGTVLKQLSAKLALPEELLTEFIEGDIPDDAMRLYHQHAINTLDQMEDRIAGSGWDMLELEEQGEILYSITRLYGNDGFTTAGIRARIDGISQYIDRPAIALYLLQQPIRKLFTNPHPSINPANSRALARPAGGTDAQSDFHDSSHQAFKSLPAWGCYNSLLWSIAQLPDEMLEPKIGLIIPPTLTLMDDFDPAWRGRGCRVLEGWISRFPTEVMKRMGLDRLLLDSTIHTLSLHAKSPLPHVLPLALALVDRTTEGAKRAARLGEIMDKGLVSGWTYAPSGAEGRVISTNIAQQLEIMCGVMSTDIVRWLKAIIPSLIGPLQYTPSPAAAGHFSANLSALLCVMRTSRSTGRIERWRGQILHVCSILAVNLRDRGMDGAGESTEWRSRLQAQLKEVFEELSIQCPTLQQTEFPTLLQTDEVVFQPLLPVT